MQQVVVIPHDSDMYSLCNDPEECSSHLLNARSLKLRILERLQQNLVLGGTWLRHCATIQKVAGSIPDDAIEGDAVEALCYKPEGRGFDSR